jgi:hypothetical protein
VPLPSSVSYSFGARILAPSSAQIIENLGAKVDLWACVADLLAHLQRHDGRQFFAPLAN